MHVFSEDDLVTNAYHTTQTVDFTKLDMATLKRYKKHFRLKTRQNVLLQQRCRRERGSGGGGVCVRARACMRACV